jgi:hypothetical protein
VSQLLRAGENEVMFSQHASRLMIKDKGKSKNDSTLTPLKEVEGLYELRVTPLYLGDKRLGSLPRLIVTRADDTNLWEHERPTSAYEDMKAPTKLGVWYCRML